MTAAALRQAIVIVILATVVSASEGVDGLKNYEIISLNKFKFKQLHSDSGTHRQHSKRDIDNEAVDKYLLTTNELKFKALGRDFHIYLKKHLNILSNNVSIEVVYANNTHKYLNDKFTSNYYIGFVDGTNDNSFVLLYYDHDNTVSGKTIIYGKIEIGKEVYYIEPSDLPGQEFMVYKISDLDTEVYNNGIFNQTFCKQKSISEVAPEQQQQPVSKEKRALGTKNRCKIALVADHRFYKNVGNSNEQLTTLHMINVMTAVGAIFEKTQFDDGIIDVGFDIEKIVVHPEPEKKTGHYNSENDYNSADDVLDLFGVDDWSSFCLAHLFTFQSFEGNVLGLAYVSSPRLNTYGGICSKLMPRKGIQFSSNIGLSSYKSPGQRKSRLFQTEAELVTTHELGHNMGSEHDPATARCTPSSSDGGNYIMYAYANQGYDQNNHKFSPCSIISITEVLKYKASVCFKEKSKSFCGNSRIEVDEECDDGLRTRQGKDLCCDTKCRLKPNAKCSDANHDCCQNCDFASKEKVCFSSKSFHECYQSLSKCTGFDKTCPELKPKNNSEPCSLYESGRCSGNGQCLSLCMQADVRSEPCFCKASASRCVQCCTNPTNKLECMPYHDLFPNRQPVYLSDGRTCLEGRCEKNVCKIKVKDHVGRFWKVIEKIASNSALEFMKRNIVGTVIILSLILWVPLSCFIHFCIDKRIRAEQKQQYLEMIQKLQQGPKQRHLSDVVTDAQKQELLLRRSDMVD